ncbi:MAG: type II secretion system F family protein [Bacilli bacterium]
MMILGIKILSFAAVFLGVLGIYTILCGKKREQEYANSLPFPFRILQTETRYLSENIGKSMVRQMPSMAKKWNNILLIANVRLGVEDIIASRMIWGFLLGGTGILMTLPLSSDPLYLMGALLVGGFLGFEYPAVAIQKAADERQKNIRKNLPFAIDLVASAMRAGLDFIAAVRYYVSDNESGPLTQEFGAVLKEIELGKSRVEALRAMSSRIQLDEFKGLVTAVAEGSEMGASIVDTLCIHAEEIRRARFAAAERQAQRAPSLMLIPMALFIMPSVFIIIFTPVFIRIKDSGFSQMF